jgi:hypothetical protein
MDSSGVLLLGLDYRLVAQALGLRRVLGIKLGIAGKLCGWWLQQKNRWLSDMPQT